MPSPLKRPIPGRLLASLRPPARAGPLPVQTGFPTSLADLVVKNHDRLKKPKRRRPTTAATATATSSPAPSPVAAVEPPPPPLQQQPWREGEVSPVRDRVSVAVRLRPELLGVGAAAALALLVIWRRWLVAAVTVASLSLFWIESIRTSSSSSYRRRPRPRPPAADAAGELPDSCGRGVVSPIREVESELAATPRLSCADSDSGSDVSVSSLWTDKRSQLDDGGDSTSHHTKRKEKRRWLRKLIAKRNSKKPKEKDSSVVSSHCELKQPDTGSEVVGNTVAGQPKAEEQQSLSEPTREAAPADGPRGGALPLAAFVPVVLVGLVAGKLPAVALTVLCAVFFTSVERRDHQLALVMN